MRVRQREKGGGGVASSDSTDAWCLSVELDVLCRNAFKDDFTYYDQRLSRKKNVKWKDEYKNRAHRERCWNTGKLSAPPTCLRGHCGVCVVVVYCYLWGWYYMWCGGWGWYLVMMMVVPL